VTIEIVPYSEDLAPAWDEFCSSAINATFLHTRRFLAYHGNRFEDVSLIMMESGGIVGRRQSSRNNVRRRRASRAAVGHTHD
jgi:hypothetical protein